jgi:hypothetical protein
MPAYVALFDRQMPRAADTAPVTEDRYFLAHGLAIGTAPAAPSDNVCFDCKFHVVWRPQYRGKVLINRVDTRLKAIAAEVCALA